MSSPPPPPHPHPHHHHRSVLETDFPLMTPPNPPAGTNSGPSVPTSSVPAAGSYGQHRPSYQQYRYQRNSQTASTSGYTSSSSLQRSTQNPSTAATPVGYRPLSAYLNTTTTSPYGRSVSHPHQTTQPQAATEWQYQSATGSTGRSGSLRRAYEDTNTTEENQPLFPKDSTTNPTVVDGGERPSPQRSQISSTTSDYHSENNKGEQTTTGQIDPAKKEPIEQALIRSSSSSSQKKKKKSSAKMR